MADINQLKQKYAPVLQTLQEFSEYGAKVDTVDMAGDQLHIKGEVPSQVIANRVWDSIKQVDPQYKDLKHEIATTGSPEQPYTIKQGDNLSKVSKLFYGTPNDYEKIAKANNIDDPNKIRAGQQIKLPVIENGQVVNKAA